MIPRSGTDRGVSTVVDVGLCLVFVSAAVLTLAVALEDEPEPHDPTTADRTAETLAATTASVDYSLAPVTDDSAFGDDEFDDDALARVAYGPTAGLLADAAVATIRVDGDRVTRAGVDYERSVESTILSDLHASHDRTRVVAVWRPYDGASIEGRTAAGRVPPTDVDVATVAMTVPSGIRPAREDAIAAAETGDYHDVASVVADATVEGYFPPEESQLALESSGLERALVVYRYRRFASALEVDLDEGSDGELGRRGADAVSANDRLAAALASTIADEMTEEYDEPGAAAEAVSTGDVTIVVRTWGRA